MPEKQKNSKKARAHKESNHEHGAGGKAFHTVGVKVKGKTVSVNRRGLSEVQKALIGGGLTHHTRPGKRRVAAEETKQGRRRIEEAKVRAEADKLEARKKKSSTQGSSKMARAGSRA